MWCCWHQCEQHMTLKALSMTSFHLLGQDDWNVVQHDVLVMWYQCWHQMMVMASSIPPKSFLVQDDQNKIQHYFFSHLILLALASGSYGANDIVNRTILFIRSRQLKQYETYLFGHVMPLMLVSVSHDPEVSSMAPLITLALALASHYGDSVINGILAFLRSR